MRNIKSLRTQNKPTTSPRATSKKLFIQIPQEDEPVEQFNKNSPQSKKIVSDIQRNSGSLYGPKHKTPDSLSLVRKLYSDAPKPGRKIFKFPNSPKPQMKKTSRTVFTRNTIKTKLAGTLSSLTPTAKNIKEKTVKRPMTALGTEKIPKKPEAEAQSNLTLNNFVTRVQSQASQSTLAKATPVPAIDSAEIRSDILYKEHLFQTFQAMKFVRALPPVNLEQLKEKRVNLPRRKGFENKKTLIFDLDETLVHCCEDVESCNPTTVLSMTFPSGETVQAGINVRPYALECLREVSKYFEVFVFTASHPCYANVVLDYLDPKKELIHQRFFRDSCINMGGVFIKDLRIFANRSLKDIILIDNAAYSFAYQIDNGIPIVSWHDDPNDKELYNLIDYVKALAVVDDIRDINEQTFHLRTFYEDYISEFLTGDQSFKAS